MLRYRLANPAPAVWNVLKTLAWLVLISGVLIWAVPEGIVSVQRRSGDFDALFFPQQVEAGKIVLLLATMLVLWAGLVLAIKGAGTPVAFDAPRRLVVSGPYAWLRTPMVTGTVLQGVGIGLMTGSIVVIGFFVLLTLLWNTFIRPTEEDQLQHLFGRSFELYRRSVRCWLPMRRPWAPPSGSTPPITLEDMPDPNRRRRGRH